MATTIWNKFLSNKEHTKPTQHAKPAQHAEPITEENLYTILGFKDVEDFENKVNKLVNEGVWQLFINHFEKDVGYTTTTEVVKNIVRTIAKIHRGNAFTKIERIILNEKQSSKKREKAIGEAIDILKEMYSTKALEELSIIKRQAEDFLQNAEEEENKNEEKAKKLKKKIENNTSLTNDKKQTEEECRQEQKKLLSKFGLSGAQLFAETLTYIQSLENLAGVEKEESIKNVLLNHVKPLNKKSSHLQSQREDAIKILLSDKLREVYNKGIEEGTLQPLASYQACETLFKKLEEQHPEEKNEVDPYTILGFKGMEDFENQVDEFTKKEIWSLMIGNLEKTVALPELTVVIETIISKIARSCNYDEFLKINPILLYGKEDITGKRKKEFIKFWIF